MVNLQIRHSRSEDKRHSTTPVQVNDSRPSRLQVRRGSVAVFGLSLDDIMGDMN